MLAWLRRCGNSRVAGDLKRLNADVQTGIIHNF